MRSLKALTSYLLSLNLFDADKFESFADSIELKYRNDTVTAGHEATALLYEKEYEAVFIFDEFSTGADKLFAIIMMWLANHDYDFDELGNPSFDIDPLDDERFYIELTIKFLDPVYTKAAANSLGFEIIDKPIPDTVIDLSGISFGLSCQGAAQQ